MKIKLLITTILLISIIRNLSTQSIVLNMAPNPSPYISDWENTPGTITLTVNNILNVSIDIKIKTELFDGSGKLIANTQSSKMPILNITPGISVFMVEEVFPLSAINYNGNLASKVRETGRIPEDNYQICVYIIDPITGIEIGQSKKTCQYFTINSFKPPILIAPSNNESIASQSVSGIMFKWSSVIPSPKFIVTYRLQVWEILEGQNYITALRINQPIVEKDIKGMTQTSWPIEFAYPEIGKYYVWTITPLDNEDRKFTEDPVFAEPFSLNIAPNLRSSSQPSCANYSKKIHVTGDEIELSDGFKLILTESPIGPNDSLSGKGKIRVSWLGLLAVQFSGIKINDEEKLCGGTIYTISDSDQDYPTQWGQFVAGSWHMGPWSSSLIKKISDKIKMDKLSKPLIEAADSIITLSTTPIKMPLGYFNNGDEINAIGFTEMRFDSVHAEFDVIASLETKGIFKEKSILDETDAIALLGTSIEFTKKGLKDIDGEIKLLQPFTINYNNDLKLTFNNESSNHIGNSVVFKSNSSDFWSYKFDINIDLPREWLIPKNTNTNNVNLNFQLELSNWDDFILKSTLPACIIPHTNGTGLDVGEIIFDHSLISNAPDLTFPNSFTGETSELFVGFYLKDFKFTLPEHLRTYEDTSKLIQVGSKNLIIDKDGITCDIYAHNIINYPKANIGNLGASIDTVKVNIVNNVLTEARIKGLITLPLSESTNSSNGLNYVGLFIPSNTSNGDTSSITFSLIPKNDIKCKFFGDGNLKINQTSSLNLVLSKVKNGQQIIKLDIILDGMLYYPTGKIIDPGGALPLDLDLSCNFESLKMSYLKSDEEKFTFDVGHWSFASPQKKLSGFSFTITDVVPKIEPIIQSSEAQYIFKGGVEFVAIINIGTDKVNIGGDVKILISGGVISSKYGTINVNSYGDVKKDYQFLTHIKAAFIGVKVLDVNVDVKIAAADINGKVSFKKNDNVYGNAFMGDITVKFKTINLGVQAGAIFGNTKYKPGNTGHGFKYWMVQAQVNLPPPGIVFMSGLAFRGFGAGVYSRMQMTTPTIFNPTTAASSTFGGAIFTPDETVSVGFKVKAIIATTPKEETLNGSVALAAEFNTNGGINFIEFDGLINLGCTIGSEQEAFASGQITAKYVFPTKIFDLNSQVLIDVRSKGIDIYTPSPINTKLHIDGLSNKWFFKSGIPTNPMDINAFGIVTNSYLMFGNDLGDDIPKGFMALTNSGWNQAGLAPLSFIDNATLQGKYKNAKGFAFGVAVKGGETNNETIFSYNGNCCDNACWRPRNWHSVTRYLNINYSYVAGGEVDASLLQYNGCNGFNNGWRASVSAAIYAGFNVGYNGNLPFTDCATEGGTLTKAGAGAMALAEFPNPTYFNGRIQGYWSVGQWSKSFQKDIIIGTQCDGTEKPLDATIDENSIHQQQNVKDSLNKKLITRIISPSSPTDISRQTIFQVVLDYPYNDPFSLDEQQSSGGIKVRTFRVMYNASLSQDSIEKGNPTNIVKSNPKIESISERSGSSNNTTLQVDNYLINEAMDLEIVRVDPFGVLSLRLRGSGAIGSKIALKPNTSYKFQVTGIMQEKDNFGVWQNATIGTSNNPIKQTKYYYFKTNNEPIGLASER
jgi:hypothetical protein